MRILHVSLGWPPFRTGGLVRYCCDLIDAQTAAGHVVAMLYPAGNRFTPKAKVRKSIRNGVVSYGVLSRNIVPLVFGVKKPKCLDWSDDTEIYKAILTDFAPDVIHVHSIQGIGESFFILAKKRNIRIVYTTHDYYPICFRANLINREGVICSHPNSANCADCNISSGLSYSSNILMQSSIYQKCKNSPLIKAFRRLVRKDVAGGRKKHECIDPETIQQFECARAKSERIFKTFDIIHCNSKIAMECYKKVYQNANYIILPITHSNIKKQKRIYCKHNPIIIGYVGGANVQKGFHVLQEALLRINDNFDWILKYYGTEPKKIWNDSRIRFCGVFSQGETEEVYRSMDVLIVPSIWRETFGFVVIEALSVGTPVICSDIVGAADLIPKEWTYHYDQPTELSNIIQKFASSKLPPYQLGESTIISMKEHANQVMSLYATNKNVYNS